MWWLWDTKRSSRESWSFFASDDHRKHEVAVVEIEEILRLKDRFELLGKDRRIVGRDAERNCRTDVAEDGVAYAFGHLRDVLVGDSEVKTVFACLGQNHGKRIGGEVLKLIDIEIKWAAIFDALDV